MPIFSDRKEEDEALKKGDLFVKFDIQFPKTLREDQRLRLERVLLKDNQDWMNYLINLYYN